MPGRNAFATNYEGYHYQFTGHEKDGETSYQYHGARYYDEDLARYMSLDPWASKFHAWSPYNYVMGNPIKLIDPTGKGPTDWVSINGQMLYDSKVTDQKTATDRYGSDAVYRAPGYEYTSGKGNKNQLGEDRKFIQNCNTFEAVDMAGKSSMDIAWNTSSGIGSENPSPFLSNLRQPGNFDFKHTPIDFPETYDIAGPLEHIFSETFIFIGTAGVGPEIGVIRSGFLSGTMSAARNFGGQYAGTRDIGEVDYLSTGFSFIGGFIPNPVASTVITGTADAAFDYTPKNGFEGFGGDKKNAAVFGDLLYNVGLGSINNNFRKDFKDFRSTRFIANTNDVLIQYANTVATQSLPK